MKVWIILNREEHKRWETKFIMGLIRVALKSYWSPVSSLNKIQSSSLNWFYVTIFLIALWIYFNASRWFEVNEWMNLLCWTVEPHTKLNILSVWNLSHEFNNTIRKVSMKSLRKRAMSRICYRFVFWFGRVKWATGLSFMERVVNWRSLFGLTHKQREDNSGSPSHRMECCTAAK